MRIYSLKILAKRSITIVKIHHEAKRKMSGFLVTCLLFLIYGTQPDYKSLGFPDILCPPLPLRRCVPPCVLTVDHSSEHTCLSHGCTLPFPLTVAYEVSLQAKTHVKLAECVLRWSCLGILFLSATSVGLSESLPVYQMIQGVTVVPWKKVENLSMGSCRICHWKRSGGGEAPYRVYVLYSCAQGTHINHLGCRMGL